MLFGILSQDESLVELWLVVVGSIPGASLSLCASETLSAGPTPLKHTKDVLLFFSIQEVLSACVTSCRGEQEVTGEQEVETGLLVLKRQRRSRVLCCDPGRPAP